MKKETIEKGILLLNQIEQVKLKLIVLERENPESIYFRVGDYCKENRNDWRERDFKFERDKMNPMREAINEILEDARERICMKFQKYLKQLQKEVDNLS